MCGRYVLRKPADALTRLFLALDEPLPDLDEDLLTARYNIAPTQEVPAVRRDKEGGLEAASLRWGLIPHWAKDEKLAARMINARMETAAEKPAFKMGVRRFRCLIPADGFLEWQRDGKVRHPHLFTLERDAPFAFAGVWARNKNGPQVIDSCSILTTAAGGTVRAIHDRMPVVVPPDLYRWWLSDQDLSGELDTLRGVEPGFIDTPVSTRVNSPRHDDPECLAPAK